MTTETTDAEVIFRFNAKDLDMIKTILKPKTSGSNISPFSTKNLPKSDYKIPDKDLIEYNKIVEKVPSNLSLSIAHIVKNFADINSEIKQGLKNSNMKAKEYYHSIGKWDEFLKYLKENI